MFHITEFGQIPHRLRDFAISACICFYVRQNGFLAVLRKNRFR
jgi:hypothetical protein